jgi:hypothetical protein
MKGNPVVEVLSAERLRSELAMHIWSQSEGWRSAQSRSEQGPEKLKEFDARRKSFVQEVSKLAGKPFTTNELIAKVKSLIAEEPGAPLANLDPATLSAKICVRKKG